MLFWGIFVILVGFGAVCLYFGYRAPAEKAQEAAKLIRGGWGFHCRRHRDVHHSQASAASRIDLAIRPCYHLHSY